jgi:uncharacterized membrane protein
MRRDCDAVWQLPRGSKSGEGLSEAGDSGELKQAFSRVSVMTADKVLNEIKDAGGTVLKTSLDEEKEQHLRDTLATATQPKAA